MSLYKILLAILSGLICRDVSAQELFVYTEPSSNMPAKSIGLRVSNWIMDGNAVNNINYYLLPEIMWGATKRLMIHTEGYFSNGTHRGFSAEGIGLYVKYRFYSKDKVYQHFRMAAFGRASTNNSIIQQEAIATNGYNTGYQVGLIATQLLHKTALSTTVYYEQATNNMARHEFPFLQSNKAINYSLSAGRLILPKSYVGYKQTNINFMLEILGQTLLENGKQYLDIAPSVQFIFNSQTRLDIGYKSQLYSGMARISTHGFLIRVEHLLYNVF
jgi:hypothetical protein